MRRRADNRRRGFAAARRVPAVLVTAVLAVMIISLFSGVAAWAGGASDEPALLQNAENAWMDVTQAYPAGYEDFIRDTQVISGWYYDYEDDVARYWTGGDYCVTYDGNVFTVAEMDGSEARVWGKVEEPAEDFAGYQIGGEPYGLVLSYYDDIYSRGFAWITDHGVTDSVLYIVPGNGGESADFASAPAITGTYDDSNPAYTSHKVWVSDLEPASVYSYKAGSSAGWKYGVFRTESPSPATITAIQLSDAQTKDPAQLAVWENTMAQAVETAGPGLDMILYNGDQYDSNMMGIGADIDRGIRSAVARETVSEYIGSVPYMASAGNHEATPPSAGIFVNSIAVDFGEDGDGGYSGVNSTSSLYGGCYSFDYAFAHFAVLNANSLLYGDPDQVMWLKDDLASANSDPSIRWIIVVMHIGLYATGDHSNTVENLIVTLAPVFSEYHVDLVMQAHDHTYSKTLPYKWDAAGYSTEYNNQDIVNFDVTQFEFEGVVYDLDPNGTYYVTTGAAGHRYGASEKGDGIWADLKNNGRSLEESGLYEDKTFTKNTYKIEVGRITQDNEYEPYIYNGVDSDQIYNVGDYASGNVNAPMFGVLSITENTLTYEFYTADGDSVKLFDTLNVMKTF